MTESTNWDCGHSRNIRAAGSASPIFASAKADGECTWPRLGASWHQVNQDRISKDARHECCDCSSLNGIGWNSPRRASGNRRADAFLGSCALRRVGDPACRFLLPRGEVGVVSCAVSHPYNLRTAEIPALDTSLFTG